MARTAEKLTQKKLNELQNHMNLAFTNAQASKVAMETEAVKQNKDLHNLISAAAERFSKDSEYLAAKIVRKMIGELSSVDSVNKFIDANKQNLPEK